MTAPPPGRFSSHELVSESKSHRWPARRGLVRLTSPRSACPAIAARPLHGRRDELPRDPSGDEGPGETAVPGRGVVAVPIRSVWRRAGRMTPGSRPAEDASGEIDARGRG